MIDDRELMSDTSNGKTVTADSDGLIVSYPNLKLVSPIFLSFA